MNSQLEKIDAAINGIQNENLHEVLDTLQLELIRRNDFFVKLDETINSVYKGELEYVHLLAEACSLYVAAMNRGNHEDPQSATVHFVAHFMSLVARRYSANEDASRVKFVWSLVKGYLFKW